MAYLIMVTFILIAIFEILAAALVFKFKDVLHAAIALSMLFFANSVAFLLLNNTILAVIQLFIMIGGISTYIFVGVSSAAYSKFKHTRPVLLVALAVALFAVMSYPLIVSGYAGTQNNSVTVQNLPAYMGGALPYLFLLLALLFGICLGGIVLLKKIGAKS